MTEMVRIVAEVIRVLRENGAIPVMWTCKLCGGPGKIRHDFPGFRADCPNQYGCEGGPNETYETYEEAVAGWNRWAKR